MSNTAPQSGPGAPAGASSWLSSVLANTAKPVAWKTGLATGLGLIVGFGVGGIVGHRTDVITALVTAFLCAVASAAPLITALRAIVIVGIGITLAVALGFLTESTPWLAALGMAFIAFVAVILQVIPVVGTALGLMTGLLYFLTVSNSFGAGAAFGRVVAASVLGLAGALIVTLVLGIWDPRKIVRASVARTLLSDTPLAEHGTTRDLLAYDGNPPLLRSILRSAGGNKLGRDLAEPKRGDLRVATALDVADVEARNLSAALIPHGRIAPRPLPAAELGPLDDAVHDDQIDRRAHLGLVHVRIALGHIRGLLDGTQAAVKEPPVEGRAIRALVTAVTRPQARTFRYGIQRALALGIGMFVYKTFDNNDVSGFWVLLAMFMVLQPRGWTAIRVAIQRTVGTMFGVLLAILASVALPNDVIEPWLLLVFLCVGVAFSTHNPAVGAAFIAAFITLSHGIPNHDVLGWGAIRLAATALGAVIAILVVRLVLPARAHPQASIARARMAAAALLDAISSNATTGVNRPIVDIDARAINARNDAAEDSSLIRQVDIRDQYDSALSELELISDDAHALILLSAVALDSDLIAPGIDKARARLRTVDEIISVMPTHT